MKSNKRIENRHSDAVVECQLCFSQMQMSYIVEHLKNLHHIADSALYNNKPLKSWFEHVPGSAGPIARTQNVKIVA